MATAESKKARHRRMRAEILADTRPLTDYPFPKLVAEEHEARYRINKLAVELWFQPSCTPAKLNARLWHDFRVKLPSGTIWRLVDRFLGVNARTGAVNGFFACVPYSRRKDRPPVVAAENATHKLKQVFKRYPKVLEKLTRFVRERRTGPEMRPVPTLTVEKIYKTFLGLLIDESHHLNPDQWPYTEKKKGYEAVRRWYHDIKATDPALAAKNELNVDSAKTTARDHGQVGHFKVGESLPVAYSRVELDEHYWDQMWTQLRPIRNDEWEAFDQRRLWALVLVETRSSAALASGVAFGDAFTRRDVLRLVHNAVEPSPRFSRLRLEDPQYGYYPDAVYPSELPQFRRNSFTVLAMDRHSTHHSPETRELVEAVIRCKIIFDKVGSPTTRPFIENWFQTLAAIAEWFESATGNHAHSPARRDPEGGAIRSRIYQPLAEELLDILARNYNVTAKRSLDGLTPLQWLQQLAKRDQIFLSPVGEFGRGNLFKLLPRAQATLTRLHTTYGPIGVNFKCGRYCSAELAVAEDLWFARTQVVDIYPQEDARLAIVVPRSFPDRVYKVIVMGRWAASPHTLDWRMLTSAAARHLVAADVAARPQTAYGLVRAFGATKTTEGFNRLVSGQVTFEDRYGNGVVTPIDMTPDEVSALLDYANGVVGEQSDAATDVADADGSSASREPTRARRQGEDDLGLKG